MTEINFTVIMYLEDTENGSYNLHLHELFQSGGCNKIITLEERGSYIQGT